MRAKPGSASTKTARDRLRAVPWAVLLQGGLVVGRRVRSLSDKDRRRLTSLLRSSRGWPGRLSERERAEVRTLLGKLEPGGIARDLMMVRGRRKRRSLKGTSKRR